MKSCYEACTDSDVQEAVDKIVILMPTTAELYCALAEEASELAQAALNIRRATYPNITSPTSMSIEEANDNLIEGISDVLACLHVLGFRTDMFLKHRNTKIVKWAEMLETAKKGGKVKNDK